MPSLFIARALPAPVEARLETTYRVTRHPGNLPAGPDALIQALREHDAIAPSISNRFTAEMLEIPDRRARIIANFGAGVDHIDLGAARAAGIVVTNTPDALTDATAEIAILLMLMVLRRAGEGERQLRAGQWPGWHPTHMLGHTLSGKTLGLAGYGRIARATGQRARALGMHVLHHSRRPSGEPGYVAQLEELAARADVLSLHVPGGPETHHLIDAAMLARMPAHAVLINTARGTVVDEAALVDALASGRIAGAGLDVYEHEPRVHPGLLACDNAVLLPHLGSATIETRVAMGMQMADNLDAFFAGVPVPNRVA